MPRKTQVMRFPLKILTVAGCWAPDSWSLCKRAMYYGYTILLCLLLLVFLIPQLMDLVLNVDNADDFTGTFYVMLAMILASCKIFSLLLNRKKIVMLIDSLVADPFGPLESEEATIQEKFDGIIKTNAVCYTIMVEMVCAFMNMMSTFTNIRGRTLTYREWTPYDLSSDALFYFTYFRQLASLTTASILNVACDCVICGLLMHICCQFEILECRLKRTLLNRGDIGECVRQHEHIYKYAYEVNEKFRFIIATQFAASMLVVCSNLYQVTKMTLRFENVPLLMYTFCMLLQILIYCWYGNEVKLKITEVEKRCALENAFYNEQNRQIFSDVSFRESVELADRIFEMDWISADKRAKENLVMIMNRSLVPIQLSSVHILTMNVDSFGKLLKASYSVYNILRTM